MLLKGRLFRNRISLIKIGILISCAVSPLKCGIFIQIFLHYIMFYSNRVLCSSEPVATELKKEMLGYV